MSVTCTFRPRGRSWPRAAAAEVFRYPDHCSGFGTGAKMPRRAYPIRIRDVLRLAAASGALSESSQHWRGAGSNDGEIRQPNTAGEERNRRRKHGIFLRRRRVTGHRIIIWRRRVACAFRRREIGFNRVESTATALGWRLVPKNEVRHASRREPSRCASLRVQRKGCISPSNVGISSDTVGCIGTARCKVV